MTTEPSTPTTHIPNNITLPKRAGAQLLPHHLLLETWDDSLHHGEKCTFKKHTTNTNSLKPEVHGGTTEHDGSTMGGATTRLPPAVITASPVA